MTAPHPPPEPRDRILNAAEREFAAKGFAGARVASIAAEAGVNKAMLYYYYQSKDGLYEAVLVRTAEQIMAVAQAAFGGPDLPAEQRLEAFVRGYRKIVLDRPEFVKMLTRDMLDGGEIIARTLAPRLRPLLQRFILSAPDPAWKQALNPEVDIRFAPLAVVAPYLFFSTVRPMIGALFGVDPDLVRPAFERTAEAITLHGLLAHPTRENTP